MNNLTITNTQTDIQKDKQTNTDTDTNPLSCQRVREPVPPNDAPLEEHLPAGSYVPLLRSPLRHPLHALPLSDLPDHPSLLLRVGRCLQVLHPRHVG